VFRAFVISNEGIYGHGRAQLPPGADGTGVAAGEEKLGGGQHCCGGGDGQQYGAG